MKTSKLITVYGMVQGIGYRPYVTELAESLGLCGTVQNSGGIVTVHAEAESEVIDEFCHLLRTSPPFGARIDRLEVVETDLSGYNNFSIIKSSDRQDLPPLLPVDLPTCSRCEGELKDPKNRRSGYHFISCVSCGPRFTIMERLPYDRDTTTMDPFQMCPDCYEEYTQKGNVRRHAQTIACHDCGPRLYYTPASAGKLNKDVYGDEAFDQAVKVLKQGGIVAIKDIGGYHLACSPFDDQAAAHLRLLKGREKKPFAVMFPDMDSIKTYCQVNHQEEELLKSIPRPIVLLRKKKDFAPQVCSNSRDTGAMLPCNPLQILLLEECGPLIMTSANLSGEPIRYQEENILQWHETDSGTTSISGLLDGVLWHERKILTPMDDSVVRVACGKVQIFRRARGYVPEPIELPVPLRKPLFAAGGDLKACFCLASGNRVYPSQYFGDLEDLKIAREYERAVERMEGLFGIHPIQAASDLHPGYHSVKYAKNMGLPLRQFQHHHAHVASVMAEHGLCQKVLGVAMDGTGYGTDGTVWGGEFLLCEKGGFTRFGHLDSVELPGGDAGAKNGQAILTGYLEHYNLWNSWTNAGLDDHLFMKDDGGRRLLRAALLNHIGTVQSSSAGRLFDAVSTLLGICGYNGYEGECAIALENVAWEAEEAYPLRFGLRQEDNMWRLDCREMLLEIIAELDRDAIGKAESADIQKLAAGFHKALSMAIVGMAELARKQEGISDVVLTGGTFQNRMLLELTWKALKEKGFSVWINEKVPSGDGGIALGQAYLTVWAEEEQK